MKHLLSITVLAVTLFPSNSKPVDGQTSTPVVSKPFWITVHIRNDETFDSLYEFFKDELQFPFLFQLEKYGNRRYTAVSANNVILEICGPYPESPFPETELRARCYTLAFRPYESSQRSAEELTRRGIKYEGPSESTNQNAVIKGFPTPVNIVGTKGPTDPNARMNKLRDELRARNGGPLGFKHVRELYIGYNSEERLNSWKELLKPARHENNVWYLPEEPNLRFVRDEPERITAFVFKVESLEEATSYLKQNNMLGHQGKGSTEIAKRKTGGLRIILEE